jgi:biopolymer transport protein ExbB
MTTKRNVHALLFVAVAIAGLCLPFLALAAPVDDAEGAAPRETMFTLIRKGGPVMIPLGLGSVIALALAVERVISLRRDRVIPPGFLDELSAVQERGALDTEGIELCDKMGGALGNIFKAGLQRLNKGDEAVEKAIEDAGFREADKMKRSLRGLSIVATVSPLMGLLGTVYGMISAFQTATSVGMGKADVLAKGIYEALVTTATGLTIAIPVLLVYQFLSGRVDALVDELDDMSLAFILHIGEEASRTEVIKIAKPLVKDA